jgi:hypothetical protein
MRNAASKTGNKSEAKKAVAKKPRTVRLTLDDAINRGLSKAQIARLDRDEIPGPGDAENDVRIYEHPEHPLYRALSKPVTIRLPLPDLRMSRLLAAAAELPYQTYIKSVLHDALMERFAKSGLGKSGLEKPR